MPIDNAVPSAFQRVLVDYMVRGATRVSWTLNRHFKAPSPATWTYQLQYDADGAVPSGTWSDIGGAAINAVQLSDSTQRPYGKVRRGFYRVKLVTPLGTHYSPPAITLGALGKEDWLKAQEITRKEILLARKKTAQHGYVLRRKSDGTPCTKCLDPGTGMVTLSKCTVCKGTRYVDGYWAAIPAQFCEVRPNETREYINPDTHMAQEDITTGRLWAIPGLQSKDLWVGAESDQRYEIHSVKVVAQVRDVPVVLEVELRQLPADDVAYTIPLVGS